ncbi:tetratricopeptide repeat protein [candidate division KSB1 bacterium]
MNFEDHKIEIMISSAVLIVFSVFIVNLFWSETTPVYADNRYQYDYPEQEEEAQSQVDIRNAKVHYNEAVRFANLGNNKRALQLFRSSIGQYPDYVPAHVKLQDIYLNMGKADSLKTVYEELMNNNPESPAYVYLHARLLDFEEGKTEYERVKQIDPMFYWSYVELGYYYLAKGEFEAAEAEFRNAIRINPALTEGQFGLGITYDRSGELFKAMKQYNMSLLISEKTTPEAYLHLGMLYETLRDTIKSIENFRKYMEFVKSGPEFEFIRSHVDSIEIALQLKTVEVESDTTRGN